MCDAGGHDEDVGADDDSVNDDYQYLYICILTPLNMSQLHFWSWENLCKRSSFKIAASNTHIHTHTLTSSSPSSLQSYHHHHHC